MFYRIALFLIAVWAALWLTRIVLNSLVHLLVIGAVIFVIIEVVGRLKKSEL